MAHSLSKSLKTGEVLFREGERAGYAYIIEKGRVVVSVEREGESVVLGTVGPGEIIGEMAVIDQHRRTATATVKEDCEVTLITPQQILQRIARADPVVRSLIRVMLVRYRSELAMDQSPQFLDETDEVPVDFGIGKMLFENELRDALNDEEVQVVYQPMRSLTATSKNGFEALVRWQTGPHGTISPAGLINLAEETDLIEPLSLYVFRAAAEDLADFRAATTSDLFLSVNISPRQTSDTDFLNRAWDICAEVNCRPDEIMLELTESAFVDIEKLREWVDAAKAMGFMISVDDFGTGYASLEYLTRLAPHTVKIDRNIIRPITHDPRYVVVVNKVLEMARELGVLAIAEGAETYEHVRMLMDMGCDMAQGFEIDRPLTKFQIIELLAG